MAFPHRSRLGGLATALGGLLFLGFGFVFFVYTHGSTDVSRRGTIFGLNGTEVCRMEVVWPALLLAGLATMRSGYTDRFRRIGRLGLGIVTVALALQIVSLVMQCWLKDPYVPSDFDSVTLTLGFYLGALAMLMLSVGMVLLGADVLRRRVLGWASPLPLVIGLLVIPTLLFEFSGLSTGTRTWDIVYAAARLPLALCWALLGFSLWVSPKTGGDVAG